MAKASSPAPISAAAPLVLGSGSASRAALLRRLSVPFEVIAPDLDETPRPGESPEVLASRLALEKGRAVAQRHPGRWVLSSDQVPSLDGEVLGKPGGRAAAVTQLRRFSGCVVEFRTAVTLLGGRSPDSALDLTRVHFRELSNAEIERYVDAEPAWDSAGSFRCEGLGISLFSAIDSSDPTALIGLPLIAVRSMLTRAGWSAP